jgi:hypothetical protein
MRGTELAVGVRASIGVRRGDFATARQMRAEATDAAAPASSPA